MKTNENRRINQFTNENIMPEFKIVDIKAMRERAGAFLSGVWNAGRQVELCLSEHNRGATVMLDEHLEPQLFSYDDMMNETAEAMLEE